MGFIRLLPGLIMAALLVSCGIALMAAAWLGWTDRFGWQIGVLALALSWVAGFNVFVLVGAFLFAGDTLRWSLLHCAALSATGMLYATGGIMSGVFQFVTARAPKRP